MVIWPLWPWPVTLTFDQFSWLPILAFFFNSLPSCQSSSKSVNNFLSYRGKSLKKSFFNGYLTLWPWPMNKLSDYRAQPSFYHETQSCQRSSKSVSNFFIYWGNSLKTVIFNVFLTPVTLTRNLDLWPNFLTIQLSFSFIILYHAAKAH